MRRPFDYGFMKINIHFRIMILAKYYLYHLGILAVLLEITNFKIRKHNNLFITYEQNFEIYAQN